MKTLSKPSASTLGNNTRPEGELLLCCARTHLDTTIRQRIQALVQQDIDWTYLIRTAGKNGVIQLLYRSLNATCPQAVPKTSLNQLRGFFSANARHNLLLTTELLKLLHLFKEHGIPAIPYKGPVLAASVYGKLSLRQFSDLDILVRERDFVKTGELLISQGYQLGQKFDWEESFVHSDSKVEVDIHKGFTPSYFPLPINFECLWQNLEPVSLLETTVVSFSPEDLLLVLCVQVAKDCWERQEQLEQLAKVCDIAELLHARQALDWGRVMEQASQLGCVRILFFSLFLARDLLSAPLPEFVLLKIQADSVVKVLAAQVCNHLFQEADDALGNSQKPLFHFSFRIERFIFYFRMRERLQHKIQYILDFLIRELPA